MLGHKPRHEALGTLCRPDLRLETENQTKCDSNRASEIENLTERQTSHLAYVGQSGPVVTLPVPESEQVYIFQQVFYSDIPKIQPNKTW